MLEPDAVTKLVGKAYTYTAAETNNPVFTAHGQVSNGTWNWKTESNMGGKMMAVLVTITEQGGTAYDFKMAMSMDGAGADLAQAAQDTIFEALEVGSSTAAAVFGRDESAGHPVPRRTPGEPSGGELSKIALTEPPSESFCQ